MKRPAVTTTSEVPGTSASRDRRMVFASSSYQRVLWGILESEILFHAPLPHYPQVDQSSNAFCIIGTFHDFSIEMQFINQKIEDVDKIHKFTNGSMQQLNFLIQNMSVSKVSMQNRSSEVKAREKRQNNPCALELPLLPALLDLGKLLQSTRQRTRQPNLYMNGWFLW